jgi:glycosyltransferase involved in cell wall biosynthesis
MFVVAVVPALDEAPRIGRVVRALRGRLGARDRIVVIDDGSADGTGEAALAAGGGGVEVIRNPRPRGVGAAIARGYERARELGADAAVVLAGDDQMDVRDLPAVLAPLRDGRADYVKGNRLAWSGGALAFPLDRLLGVIGLAAATRLATGLDVNDAQCGYTAIGRRALAEIDWAGWADAWPGYGYPNDWLIRLAQRGLRVVEVPVRPVYDGAPSKLRWRHLPPIVRRLAAASVARALRTDAADEAPAPPARPATAAPPSTSATVRAGWPIDDARGRGATWP